MSQFWRGCEDAVRTTITVLQILFWAIVILISLPILFVFLSIISFTFSLATTFIPPPLFWLGMKLVPTEFVGLHSSISSASMTDMMAMNDVPFPFSRIHWFRDLTILRALAVRQQMGREIWNRMVESESSINQAAKQSIEQLKPAMRELEEMQPLMPTLRGCTEPGLHDTNFVDRFATRLWQTVDPGISRIHTEMPLMEDVIAHRLARDQQERPLDSWHQVWVSKTAGPEYAAHWLLVIDGKKYELRRTSRKDRRRYPTRKNQKYMFLADDAGQIDISQREVFLERPPKVSTRGPHYLPSLSSGTGLNVHLSSTDINLLDCAYFGAGTT
ncbi:hypothetical protein P154DRAFT_532727 [Amniculicola lignicola CBS 123094]|uniref:Uncharacterized protein n=1 Tax=Amniculicola lignicola CBS 123094 TaxID=1392246 RepID=A0A6A5WRP8_9PLEO|nr:hypothetical protein P154DRAFT_532727 [Amniculicola lignicola CBS 123094]